MVYYYSINDVASLSLFRVFADAEFQFPALVGLGAYAPEFQYAQFGDVRLEADGHIGVFERLVGGQNGFQRIGFGQIVRRSKRKALRRAVVAAGG